MFLQWVSLLGLLMISTTFAQDRSPDASVEDLTLIFRPSVFAGDSFPKAQFENPDAARRLLGDYHLQTSYYTADHHPATRPSLPGRYGAVTRITPAGGQPFHRYNTLFRQPHPQRVDWEEFQTRFATALPEELGINPSTARHQSAYVSAHLAQLFGDSFAQNAGTAALLAGLYEIPPDSPPLPQRLGPMERDREWWFAQRKLLGDEPKYPYAAILPDGYEQHPDEHYPVILFLHGSGERGHDLSRVTQTHGPQKYLGKGHPNPFLILIPQCPSHAWWFAPQLLALLDQASGKYRVDPDRIYLTGLSMGGYGTYDLAMYAPDRFAAIVPICGAGDTTDVQRIRELPCWIFHGGKDQAVPIERMYQMKNALLQVHARATWTIYPELPHDSWTITYSNPALYDWLLAQSRSHPAQAHLSD